MRILNITAQKPDSTGSGVYLASLVRAFSQVGHEAGVIAGAAADDPCAVEGATYMRSVRFGTAELPFPICGMSDEMPYPSTRYRDLTPVQVRQFEGAFAAALDEALAAFHPDAIVCHHLYLLTALVRERVSGIPVVAVCHSTDLRQMRTHDLQRERIVAAMRGLDAVLSLHNEQRDEIIACYGVDPARITVVGTGFEASVFNGGDREEVAAFGLAAPAVAPLTTQPASATPAGHSVQQPASVAPLKLVYVGKISRKKGVASLLEALDKLPAPRESVRLRLVGGHGDTSEYVKLRERALACVHPAEFAGRVDQDELVRSYREADVFVLPSFYEGLPLVVIEALACGCRVVVTDLPGIRPWLASRVPRAPIVYVEPPRLHGADEPYVQDLPAFEQRLACAIERAAQLPRCTCDLSGLSWGHLAERMANLLREASAVRYTCS